MEDDFEFILKDKLEGTIKPKDILTIKKKLINNIGDD